MRPRHGARSLRMNEQSGHGRPLGLAGKRAAATLEALAPLARWVVDPRQADHLYADAGRTTAITNGTPIEGVSDLSGEGITWTGGGVGPAWSNVLGGRMEHRGGESLRTSAAIPTLVNDRILVVIMDVRSPQTKGVMDSRNASIGGWSWLVDNLGRHDLLHWQGGTAYQNVVPYVAGTIQVAIWRQSSVDGMDIRIDGQPFPHPDTFDATDVGDVVHWLGSQRNNTNPVDADCYYAAEFRDGDVDIDILEQLLLERRDLILRDSIETLDGWIFQLQDDADATVPSPARIIGNYDAAAHPDGLEIRATQTGGATGAWVDVDELTVPSGMQAFCDWRHELSIHADGSDEWTVEVRSKTTGLAIDAPITIYAGGQVMVGGQSNAWVVSGAVERSINAGAGTLHHPSGPRGDVMRTDTTLGWHADFINRWFANTGRRCLVHVVADPARRLTNFLPSSATPSQYADVVGAPGNRMFPDLDTTLNNHALMSYASARLNGLDPTDIDPVRDGHHRTTTLVYQGESDQTGSTAEASYEADGLTTAGSWVTDTGRTVGWAVIHDVQEEVSPGVWVDYANVVPIQNAQRGIAASSANVYTPIDESGTTPNSTDRIHYEDATDSLRLGDGLAVGAIAGRGDAA